jgi:hypothetical protein
VRADYSHARALNDPGQVAGAYALMLANGVTGFRQMSGSLALADESFDEQRALDLAALFAEQQTWHCPTLIRLHTQQFPDEPEHSADPRLRFIAPDEVARWRRSAAKFARLPEASRQALRAHWPVQLRLTKTLADAASRCLPGPTPTARAGSSPASPCTMSSTCSPRRAWRR